MSKSNKDMKIFITGGAGFIGSRLAIHLQRAGAEVLVYDNLHPQAHDGNATNQASLHEHSIKLTQGDVRDGAALGTAMKEFAPNIVYHLAAETGTGQSFDLPTRYCDVNVMGTTKLIEAVRATGGVSRIILAGSRSVYGEGACVDTEGIPAAALERVPADLETGIFAPKDLRGRLLTPVPTAGTSCPVAPASVYASTKLMQEYLLTQAFWGTGVDIGILRLQNVYGPGQSLNNPYTGVLSIFARQIQEGRQLKIYEDGEITRDFVLVDDVVSAFGKMARVERVPTDIIDIGMGEGATILNVAKTMLRAFGESSEKYTITGAFRPGDIRYGVANIDAAKQQLDWAPENTLQEGLAKLVLWSKEAYKQSPQEVTS